MHQSSAVAPSHWSLDLGDLDTSGSIQHGSGRTECSGCLGLQSFASIMSPSLTLGSTLPGAPNHYGVTPFQAQLWAMQGASTVPNAMPGLPDHLCLPYQQQPQAGLPNQLIGGGMSSATSTRCNHVYAVND